MSATCHTSRSHPGLALARARRRRRRGDLREPFVAIAAERDDHDGADGRGGIVCRCPREAADPGTRARRLAGVLPGAGDASAVRRLEHQDGAVAARLRRGSGGGGWNGKFRGTGNGGLGGGAGVDAGALANGVRRGYATAGHNTGHEGDSSYAMIASREDQGLRLPVGARNDGRVEGDHQSVLRHGAHAVVHGGRRRRHDRGAQLGAAVSRTTTTRSP